LKIRGQRYKKVLLCTMVCNL